MHVSYNSKISTSYSINDSMINLKSHHKDLGIVVSDDYSGTCIIIIFLINHTKYLE